MKPGLISHSPLAAQSSQYWFVSEHPGAGAVVGGGGAGVVGACVGGVGDGGGDSDAVILTSAHCVQICDDSSQSQRKDNTYSPRGRFSGIFTMSTMRKSIISPQYSARSAGGMGLYAQPLVGPLPHNPGIGVGNCGLSQPVPSYPPPGPEQGGMGTLVHCDPSG